MNALTIGLLILAGLLVGSCADSKLPPLPTAGPDLCLIYSSFRYGDKAAQLEELDALRKHNANEIAYSKDCLTDAKPQPSGLRAGPK